MLQAARESRRRPDSQSIDDKAQALAHLGRDRKRKVSRSHCNALRAIGRDEQEVSDDNIVVVSTARSRGTA